MGVRVSIDELPGWNAFAPTYDLYLDKYARPHDVVVEVGVLYGKSVAYLAHGAIARGIPITIYAVDPWCEWEDSNSTVGHTSTGWPWPELQAESGGGPFGTFCDQMLKHARAELEVVHVLRLRSLYAARIFDDRSLAMVMLDGSHAYEDVRDDIRAWAPKVRTGGIFAGDDFAPDFPGVVRAVREAYGDRAQVSGTTWRVTPGLDVQATATAPGDLYKSVHGMSTSRTSTIWHWSGTAGDHPSSSRSASTRVDRRATWPSASVFVRRPSRSRSSTRGSTKIGWRSSRPTWSARGSSS